MDEAVPPEALEVGPGANVDAGAILGYGTGREVKAVTLKIGANARVRSGSVIYAGSTIGDDLETGHGVVIREENRIGDRFSIWSNSIVDYGCCIGDRVRIHCNVYVAQLTVLEDDVFLAPGVVIANDPHPGCPEFRQCMRGPTIRRGAKIGANVTVMPFLEIGRDAVIGAGTVVTSDVPPRSVVYGSPMRVVCTIDELKCRFGFVEGPYRHLATNTTEAELD